MTRTTHLLTSQTRIHHRFVRPQTVHPFLHHVPTTRGYAGYISGQIYPNFPFNDSLVPSQLSLPLTQTVPETQPQNVEGSSSGKKPARTRSHKKKTPTKKALIAANRQPLKWTPNEELALTRAWISESEKEQGTSRHKNDFWIDINKAFHMLMQREFYRANDSLSSKWTEINKAMNAFQPHYYYARNNPKSGQTDGDYLTNALLAYKNETNSEFKFLNCWEVTKHHSKWAYVPTATNSSKRTETNSSRNRSFDRENQEAINLDDDDFDEELSRPPGRDKSKKRSQKSTASGSGSGSTGA